MRRDRVHSTIGSNTIHVSPQSRRRILRSLVAVLTIAGFSACGDRPVSKEQYNQLLSELDSLRGELDELRNGPERHLTLGKQALQDGRFDDAKGHAAAVLRIDPVSPFAEEARQLAATAQLKLDKALAAMQRKTAEEEDEKRASIKHLRKDYDAILGITWYYHESSPRYRNQRSAIYLYFGVWDGRATPGPPRFTIEYVSSDWLFVENYTIKADDKSFSLHPGGGEIETDSGIRADGEVGIWEWLDAPVKDFNMIRAIANSAKVVLRYSGKQYYHDRTIPASEKKAMQQVLLAWESLGGTE